MELQSQLEKLDTQSADTDVSCSTFFTECIFKRKYFIAQCFSTACCQVLWQSLIADLEQKMLDHCNKTQTIQNEMNIVEDTVFADFCDKIDVGNIREYEGIGLR